ncbi:MAG: endopeptidase La [Candidatus Tectomicrobia bacterium]|nr:endopeptidase La [Candidatus Tectomicrobia bacterium]
MPSKSKSEQEIDPRFRIPKELPLLSVRDTVVFPYMVVPLFIGRESSLAALDASLSEERLLIVVAQREERTEEPTFEELYEVGTVSTILRVLKMPDGRVKIVVQGLVKARITEFLQKRPFYRVKVERFKESRSQAKKGPRTEALVRNLKEQLETIISISRRMPADVLVIADELDDHGKLADTVIANLGMRVEQSQKILEMPDPEERLEVVADLLNKEVELMTMQQKIQTEAKEEMSKTQREFFLREQLKAIQKELGEVDEKTEEINDLRIKIEEAKMPTEVDKEVKKQLRRLEKMHPDAAEASMVRTYIEWLVELPWSKSTEDNLDIKEVSKVLNEDHYDLEKVKERIVEYLAVRKLKQKMKGPILCFVGPPGVGKTSLGRSIARAMGRQFVRISLGGVRDEAEIRGHRRTYVGSLPGRIIQGIKQAGSNNPVFIMDEVDKIGLDFRGDPAAALLEVLDPEQNNSFTDHYLGVPFDLSNVMFITTANLIDPIPSALKDRMEIITIPGYTEEEKLRIAREFILPKQFAEHGLDEKHLMISDRAVLQVITQYTREAGLRNLEREIATICRKVARRFAEGEEKLFKINSSNLHHYLGVRKFLPETEQEKDEIGVTTGLAVTPTGGEVIYVEATPMKGKGALTLTGQLGDVMKESAQAAMSYTRAKAQELGLHESFYSKTDIHIHVPAGAIPKDGPSAGITIATAIVSVLTGIPVKKEVAMTGEITLRGRVLPIGGVKEKTLAAKRAGIKTVILPQKNEKDLDEIPKNVRRDLKFVFVKEMDEVLDVALVKPPKSLGKRREADLFAGVSLQWQG